MPARDRRTRTRRRHGGRGRSYSPPPPPRQYRNIPPPPPRYDRRRSRSRSIDYGQRPVYLVRCQENPTPVTPDEDAGENADGPPQALVRYRAVYKHERTGGIVYQATDTKPLELPKEESRQIASAFDVVTEYATVYSPRPVDGWQDRPRYPSVPGSPIPREDRNFSSRDDEKEGPPKLQVASLKGMRRLEIHSSAIIHALQQVVTYWPGLNLLSPIFISLEPHMFLLHHLELLRKFRSDHAPGHALDLCEKAADVYEHLGLLDDYLEKEVMPGVAIERARHQRSFATFEYMWLLFKPGAEVLVRFKDDKNRNFLPFWRGGIVQSITLMTTPNDKYWEVKVWNLTYDGSTVGRGELTQYIDLFEGESAIGEMDMIPADWPGHLENGRPVAEILREKGRQAYRLLSPRCMTSTGKSLEFPYNDVEGLVMVDMRTFYTDQPDERPYVVPNNQIKIGVTDCNCPVCEKRKAAAAIDKPPVPYSEYDNLEIGAELTDQMSFLYSSRLYVFHFGSRTWELLDVDDLKKAQFKSEVLDTLVMRPERINMLKALSKKYMRSEDGNEDQRSAFWSADFIENKGKSQIVLLHGKPGVGKTYTAECIAEYTRRPLITLTCADIGTDPEEVELNLEYHFTSARDWGALVLIDEADIYMEKRSSNDLVRNSLVAGFLRALEVYEGMLFLTTNRVGAFDDAFTSRIHVKLYYNPLSDSDRQRIWSSFISKLTRERRKDIRVTIGAKEYISGPVIKALDLNGREIRNAFQTAVALAEYEAVRDEEGTIMVEEHHVQQVAEMSREFRLYLNELHKGDEEKRAARAFERLDRWLDGNEVNGSTDREGGAKDVRMGAERPKW
ncbi:hypothetical protein B0A48_05373 [Cryoendolithus antarcticus]|uniref:AAA+ ATPase domain-containing protein n=1 Tax=Cryoendolithus antarcticus TaxID=1507870 RepID=A0A1V8TIN8_9PEZI|nr:hypothetical protein B0A48_05373 [Cryoendolithus antarcticus]